MAIKPPGWCSNAVPGKNGWTDPVTGEVYASARFSQAQIDEYMGFDTAFASEEFQEIIDYNTEGKIQAAMIDMGMTDDTISDLNNDGTIDVLESLTKKELEELGRENGIELDRRKSKKSLVETMRNIMSK
jgi:ribosomal protein S12 methylthiotransferase accessory factor YcaO